ncbi:hypothetical protein HY523_02725 [Candidatus Berkelbacteria bacterium]|nr:hypothetical protein [Candidatus Berkelbacteria bacterium]
MKNFVTAQEIDSALAPVLRQMETVGVELDTTYLASLNDDLTDQLTTCATSVFELVGHEFLLSSPKQLSKVLFQELQLAAADGRSPRRRTTGFSTAAADLEQYRDTHPVIPEVLRYREVSKLLSTYVQPLPQLVGADGRLHTHYAPDAASGRLSSRQPNLQNIPIRSDLGRQIRRAFVAEEGWQFVAADYSQIQLRIIAHLSEDQAMMAVFTAGGDIHTATGEALGVDRRTAKAINFGMVYGLTTYGLGQSLQVSTGEADSFIQGFFATYPDVARYMERLICDARAAGFATTMHGKQRPLPDLTSLNDLKRKAAERVALNHPIQGAEAELMKLAMIALHHQLLEEPAIRMILQVHDELVFEIRSDQVGQFLVPIRAAMETVVPLTVPTPVAFKVGPNWADLEPIDITV